MDVRQRFLPIHFLGRFHIQLLFTPICHLLLLFPRRRRILLIPWALVLFGEIVLLRGRIRVVFSLLDDIRQRGLLRNLIRDAIFQLPLAICIFGSALARRQ